MKKAGEIMNHARDKARIQSHLKARKQEPVVNGLTMYFLLEYNKYLHLSIN